MRYLYIFFFIIFTDILFSAENQEALKFNTELVNSMKGFCSSNDPGYITSIKSMITSSNAALEFTYLQNPNEVCIAGIFGGEMGPKDKEPLQAYLQTWDNQRIYLPQLEGTNIKISFSKDDTAEVTFELQQTQKSLYDYKALKKKYPELQNPLDSFPVEIYSQSIPAQSNPEIKETFIYEPNKKYKITCSRATIEKFLSYAKNHMQEHAFGFAFHLNYKIPIACKEPFARSQHQSVQINGNNLKKLTINKS